MSARPVPRVRKIYPFIVAQAPDGTVSERWQIDNEKDVRLYRKTQSWAA
ncbi:MULTISPECIES: hypothetical protein [Xanthomonas translucens group]|nr:hypothetical protein [Xanthomonas translucens]UKE68706.1 hypothetical protein K8O61_14645 [Xanthomonas translucens pv. pistacia]